MTLPLYRTVLVALDGSSNAERVLPIAEKLLQFSKGKALLFQGVPDLAPDAANDAYLKSVAARLKGQGIESEAITARGETAGAIVDASLSRHCDLVAFTTHGKTGEKRWVFGSVAEKVLRSCPVPLLVARGMQEPPAEIKRVVVPLDGSPGSETVLPHASEFARHFGASCLLLHVVEPLGIEARDSKLRGWLDKRKLLAVGRLEAAAAHLRSQGIEVTVATLEGDPASRILAAAAEAPSLVAISSHGRSGFSRWVFGSVTERVLQHVASPVMVVRHEDAAEALEEVARRAPMA